MQLSLFPFPGPYQVLIGNKPFLSGHPTFDRTGFGYLQPGMAVHKIGITGRNGKATSSSRIDIWTPYIEYMGAIEVEGLSKDRTDQCLAFKLPPRALFNKATGQWIEVPFFVLYIPIGKTELVRPNFRRRSIEIFKAIFTLHDGRIIDPS